MFHKLFLSLALFVFILTGCEFQEPVPQIVVQAAKGNSGCASELRYVELQSMTVGSGNYIVMLETGPFVVAGCMCKLLSYQLSVTQNSSSQWQLTLAPDLSVPFTTSASEINDVLTISDLEPIFRNIGNPGNGLLKVTDLTHVPVANAELHNAGGLCVIENYDGTGPLDGPGTPAPPVGATANAPIIRFKPGSMPDSYIVEVFIPVSITTPI